MATHTLSILKPSVNNLTTRIFVRAAELDFDEVDVWGKKSTPEFLSKDPADLTPLLEEAVVFSPSEGNGAGPEPQDPPELDPTMLLPSEVHDDREEIQDGDRWIHQAILYRDTYERRDGRWFFVRRIHELWYGAEVGVNPLTLEPANWPEHHDGMGTVPAVFPTWDAFWS